MVYNIILTSIVVAKINNPFRAYNFLFSGLRTTSRVGDAGLLFTCAAAAAPPISTSRSVQPSSVMVSCVVVERRVLIGDLVSGALAAIGDFMSGLAAAGFTFILSSALPHSIVRTHSTTPAVMMMQLHANTFTTVDSLTIVVNATCLCCLL